MIGHARRSVAPAATGRPPRMLYGGRIAVSGRGAALRAVVGTAVLFGPCYALLRLAGALGRPRVTRAVERWWARRAARWLRARVEVSGSEHIDRGASYVVVALHESLADPLALSHLPLPLAFVARDELASWRFLGGALRSGRHIVIEPEAPRRAARALIAGARDALARGDSLLVFPQGSVLGLEIAFQPGAFALARRLGVPLLPVVVTGGHRAWEHPFAPTLRLDQRITVRVLPAVPGAQAVARRGDVERAMKRAALGAGMAPARRFEPARDGYWDGYRYEIDPRFGRVSALVRAHRDGDPRGGSGVAD